MKKVTCAFGKKSSCHWCPERPVKPKAPVTIIEKSSFSEDWYKVLKDPIFHDVTFIVEETIHFNAHSIVLCASSQFFEKLFASSNFKDKGCDQVKTHDNEDSIADNKEVLGLSEFYVNETADGRHMTLKLRKDIKVGTFDRVLEFVYTGKPCSMNNIKEDDLWRLKGLSAMFELPYFDTICENIVRKEEFLNANLLALFNHQRVSKLKSMCLNQSHCSDVVFLVDDRRVYAHKVVLSARSQVMSAMFSGYFLEGKLGKLTEITVPDASHENFCALLDYLYTDHAPLKQISDVTGLLALADNQNLPRLVNLCELYISRMMEKAFQQTPDLDDSDFSDIFGMLNTAQILNAQQLASWCLHFIAVNYESFSQREEFQSLSGVDQTYIERNRWPPLAYLESVETYEREATAERKRRRKDKCAVT